MAQKKRKKIILQKRIGHISGKGEVSVPHRQYPEYFTERGYEELQSITTLVFYIL